MVFPLEPGERRVIETGTSEVLAIPLAGGASIFVDDEAIGELRARASVFEDLPDFAYAPPESRVEIVAHTGGEFAIPMATAERLFEPQIVPREDVQVEARGAGRATRQITNLCTASTFEADRILSVEVLTPRGNLSSYPPHKHDRFDVDTAETDVEEIYYFRFRPSRGYGLHRQYHAEGAYDVTVPIRDGDVFLVPNGYHGPSVALPHYDMYFLNVLAGNGRERSMQYADDPAEAWVREAWSRETPDPRVPMTGPGASTRAGAD
jgi:5-deoxy-glucuronate isomerase